MNLHLSPLESARFNLRVFRGSTDKLAPYDLLRTIVDERVDVAILRIPTSEQHTLNQLSLLPWPVIAADTVVTFDGDLRHIPPQPLRNSRLIGRRATIADRGILEELVDLSFRDYRTHYYSNPLFDPQLVLAGYKEWALGCLNPGDEHVGFLFYVGEEAVAYATIGIHDSYSEGLLFGARPGASVRGLYPDLIRFCKQYVAEHHSARRIYATSQVQNHGVQRVWIREGFLPVRSYCTIHINALLGQRAPLQ
jgi:hypothetical protein